MAVVAMGSGFRSDGITTIRVIEDYDV